MRVMLVDDHRLITDMLSEVLADADGVEVVGVARSGEEAIEMASRHKPDVILMDIEMEGIRGIDATRTIVQARPEARVVMLTGSGDQSTIVDAIESGAVGYLTKDQSLVDDVVDALRRAHEGEIMVPAPMIGRIISSLAARQRERTERQQLMDRLTPREREILHLLAEGADNKTIADRLVVSPHTVRTHVQNVLAKLGAHSKLEALTIAARRGLVTLG